jgi:hypothetical protein
MLFTDRRLILVDKQGATGASRVPLAAVPRDHALQHRDVGALRPEAELRIWVSGRAEPFATTFNARLDIYAVQAVLAGYVCRDRAASALR